MEALILQDTAAAVPPILAAHLLLSDLAHSKVLCTLVAKVQAADRRGRQHGQRIGQLNARILLYVQ